MSHVGGFSVFSRAAMRSALTSLLLFVSILFAVGVVAKPASPSSAKEKVMVFGDSLSAGYGLRPNEGWVSLLAEKLAARQIPVVNASISGETTQGGLSRLQNDLSRNQPTVVVLALGANDGLRGLPVMAMRRNLEQMINMIRAAGARTVLVGMQLPPNFGPVYVGQFQAVFRELAEQHRLASVPFLLDGFAERLELFQPDRLHPTAQAQPLILKNIMPALDKALAHLTR